MVGSDTSSVLWVIDASLASRKLRITAIHPPAIDFDQVHQLWMIDPASDGVKSLGLLPQTPDSTITLESSEINGNVATLAVSLEPVAGSPLSGPSGPVLYQGDFTLLNNSDGI